MNQVGKIVEPLAKFHALITTKGRFTIPKETRKLYRIDEGDFVELIVRKIDPQTLTPTKRAVTILKVSTNGVCVLPKVLMNTISVNKGDIIELLLMSSIKPEEIL